MTREHITYFSAKRHFIETSIKFLMYILNVNGELSQTDTILLVLLEMFEFKTLLVLQFFPFGYCNEI